MVAIVTDKGRARRTTPSRGPWAVNLDHPMADAFQVGLFAVPGGAVQVGSIAEFLPIYSPATSVMTIEATREGAYGIGRTSTSSAVCALTPSFTPVAVPGLSGAEVTHHCRLVMGPSPTIINNSWVSTCYDAGGWLSFCYLSSTGGGGLSSYIAHTPSGIYAIGPVAGGVAANTTSAFGVRGHGSGGVTDYLYSNGATLTTKNTGSGLRGGSLTKPTDQWTLQYGLASGPANPWAGSTGVYVTEMWTSRRGITADEAAYAHEHPFWWLARLQRRRVFLPSGATALSVASMAHAHAIGAPSISSVTPLTVSSAAHAYAIDAPSLSAVSPIAADNAAHAHSIDVPTITAHALLSVDNAGHAHAIDAASVTTSGATALVVQSAAHAHSLGTPSISAVSPLAVDSSAHVHATAQVTLTAHTPISAASIAHVMALAEPALATILSVDSATHSHSIGAPTMTGHTIIAVSSALHAQLISAANVGIAGLVPVGDSIIVYADDATVIVLADTTEITVQ